MFRAKASSDDNEGSVVQPDAPPIGGDAGKKCKLTANCFNLVFTPNCIIYHYKYSLSPSAKDAAEEQRAVQEAWPRLQLHLGAFVVRCPCNIFSTTKLNIKDHLQIPVEADTKRGYGACEMSVALHKSYTGGQMNSGTVGEAGVVIKHIVKRMAGQMMYQKVGRRYFNNSDAMEGKDGGKPNLTIFSGFQVALSSLHGVGPQIQVDIMSRALHKRNIIESLTSGLDADAMNLKDVDVKAEWRRRCLRATVVTLYNNRIYRIKAVNFEKNPTDKFEMYQREEGKKNTMSFLQFYMAYYNREIAEQRQPLLEAYPEKDTERVFLVPELCAFTGMHDEMRKDKNMMGEALRLTKAAPLERLPAILSLAKDMAHGAVLGDASPLPIQAVPKLMQDWRVALNQKPQEIDARIFEPLEVIFGGQKRYVIEEGNFQRWMRNGLQCPIRLDDWLFIYPETDVPVVDIWLRSLRDIASVAFTMKMADPVRITCTDQRRDLVQLLEQKLTPRTQMVLLLTPQADSKRVYQLFKTTTCTKYPCVTQVVKSETIRKRTAIAAVLSRIVLQINAKSCGPLWHIDLESTFTEQIFRGPAMVIGIDIYTSHDGKQHVGFAGSLDSQCTEYYSTASALDDTNKWQSMSVKLQDMVRNALLEFSRRNDGLLPEHIIVYRASVNQSEIPVIKAMEVGAIEVVLQAVKGGASGEAYKPHLTFIAISKQAGIRFFAPSPNQDRYKNPEPGTVIDTPYSRCGNMFSFYLINQAVGKGTAIPTHYVVIHDTADLGPNVLQNLSYKLSFLYYNYTGSIKMPAPAQYAKKIANLIGTSVRVDPHKRLLCTFFYL
mmetsp:Transcript_34138/g.95988  ORF Transcript_34138/g.95988 Transcript_34138/m.95988 type:complete len:830 (+) Transcript_34138:88-2577(+)